VNHIFSFFNALDRKELKQGSVLFEETVTEKAAEEESHENNEEPEKNLFLDREDYAPYQASIEKLRTLQKYSSMQDKLDCILGTIQVIIGNKMHLQFIGHSSSSKRVLAGS
jgi:hypothetical protein